MERPVEYPELSSEMNSEDSVGTSSQDMKNSSGKNIIICFDGTHNKFGPSPYTNLLKFFRMLEKDDPESQICYYQPGIGASMSVDSGSWFQTYCSTQNIMDNLDSLIAFSLDEHIIQAYKYLVRSYRNGDKVYMFGFSRGAFSARVLASMIDRVGLLNQGLEELAESAWAIYSAWEYALQPSQPDYTTTLISEYRKTFSRESLPDIQLLGMFDCVNSVGLVRDRLFPLSAKSDIVKSISHAVSLDERRGKYRQNLIFPFSYRPSLLSLTSTEKQSTNSSRRITNVTTSLKSLHKSSLSSILSVHFGEKSKDKIHEAQNLLNDVELRLIETSKIPIARRLYKLPRQKCDHPSISTIDKQKFLDGEYQEVWFPGNHGDVGGGFAPDVYGQFLSNVPLRWMFAQAIEKGVKFQKHRIVNFNKRYSSIDSMLSCHHDLLSMQKGTLTHSITNLETRTILKLSKSLFNKECIPEFRSCEFDGDLKFDELFSNGVYLTSLKKIKSDLANGDSNTKLPSNLHTIEDIFGHYTDIPPEPIQGFDGHGRNSLLTTLMWWIVELIPIGTKIEDEDDKWRNHYVPNLGRSRSVPQYSKLHWSVYWRMKYCYDYDPKNIPEYALEIIKEFNEFEDIQPIVIDEGSDQISELIKRQTDETRKLFGKWALEKWKIVPDDLTPLLQKYNYLDEE